MTKEHDLSNEAEFESGFEAACDAYVHGKPSGDPEGVSDSYRHGWWCGVGWSAAWEEGRRAAKVGLLFCPYAQDDQDCFVAPWQNGYAFGLRETKASKWGLQ